MVGKGEGKFSGERTGGNKNLNMKKITAVDLFCTEERYAPAFMAITGQVRREFGISNPAQAHAWNNGRKSVEKNKSRPVTESSGKPQESSPRPGKRVFNHPPRSKESFCPGGQKAGKASPQTSPTHEQKADVP